MGYSQGGAKPCSVNKHGANKAVGRCSWQRRNHCGSCCHSQSATVWIWPLNSIQAEAISDVLHGRDLFVTMLTGYGKFLIYHILSILCSPTRVSIIFPNSLGFLNLSFNRTSSLLFFSHTTRMPQPFYFFVICSSTKRVWPLLQWIRY